MSNNTLAIILAGPLVARVVCQEKAHQKIAEKSHY